mmetsp:Transcript_52378/g.111591  ORF Transcript_52378/g.111591 Transcript_52378/m.111591 type:complete len:213 (+) Transcript_52378:903-1541(+)
MGMLLLLVSVLLVLASCALRGHALQIGWGKSSSVASLIGPKVGWGPAGRCASLVAAAHISVEVPEMSILRGSLVVQLVGRAACYQLDQQHRERRKPRCPAGTADRQHWRWRWRCCGGVWRWRKKDRRRQVATSTAEAGTRAGTRAPGAGWEGGTVDAAVAVAVAADEEDDGWEEVIVGVVVAESDSVDGAAVAAAVVATAAADQQHIHPPSC